VSVLRYVFRQIALKALDARLAQIKHVPTSLPKLGSTDLSASTSPSTLSSVSTSDVSTQSQNQKSEISPEQRNEENSIAILMTRESVPVSSSAQPNTSPNQQQ
jgi:hypothetical protein